MRVISDFSGKAVANTTDWKYLDMNYQVIWVSGRHHEP